MATTQILPFCTEAAGSGGNRLSPTDYAALTAILASGFGSGTASSAQANTALAQATFMAAGLANFCVAQGVSVPDDGNLSNLVTEITNAISALALSASQANYPVGSLYFNASNATNPGTLLGFGTWTAFGAGQVPIGVGTFSDGTTSETITGGQQLGEYNHTLSTGEMPSHNHSINDPDHAHNLTGPPVAPGTGGNAGWAAGGEYGGFGQPTATATATTGITINNTGGGGGHNNIQPSIGVYIWKRTA